MPGEGEGAQSTDTQGQQQGQDTTKDTSLLGDGGNGNSSGLEIPEKFRTTKEDGSIDYETSMQKVLQSYSHLEKKIGTGDLPPEKEDGYKLDYSKFPEGVKIEPEREKGFLKSCHAMGMTNKQVQGVMDRYAELITEGLKVQGNQKQAAIDVLKKDWGENFDANVQAAQKGFLTYADEQDKANIDQLGNNPALLRLLAKIGKDIKEDSDVKGGGGSSIEDVETLMRSVAYWDDKHPDHKSTKQKVQTFYQKKYSAEKG